MTHTNRFDPDPTAADRAALAGRLSPGPVWGDLSVDQPDGFGTLSEPELPSPDLNDDRGYGFGV